MGYMAFDEDVQPPVCWRIFFCGDEEGRSYVDSDLFDDLRSKDPVTYERVFDRIDRITRWDLDTVKRSHYYKPLEDGLVELRLSVGSEVRFLGFVSYDAPSPIVYILCGFRKKTDPIPSRYLRVAHQRYRELHNIRGPTL